MLPDHLAAFFDSYGSAFEHFDAERIADHFALPSQIVSDGETVSQITLSSRRDCVSAVAHVLARHRKLGKPVFRLHPQAATELSPLLVCVSLHIEVCDPSGPVHYDFDAVYTLIHAGQGWLISSIAHNQIPRLNGLIRR